MAIAMPEETATEVIRVPHPDDMDTETFCKHFSVRHPESLPEGFTLSPDMDEYVEECWRRFHERLHRLRLSSDPYEHAHKLPRSPR